MTDTGPGALAGVDDLITLLRDELGLPVTPEHAHRRLDEIPGWDSVHLLWLLTVLEKSTGRRLSLPDLLDAPDLAGVHALAVGT